MTYYTEFKSAHEAEAAFNAYIASRPEADRADLEANSINNAFSVEVHGEYEDDLHRWTVALNTAKDYVDQGVTGF